MRQAVTLWQQLTGTASRSQIRIPSERPHALSVHMGGNDKRMVAIVYRRAARLCPRPWDWPAHYSVRQLVQFFEECLGPTPARSHEAENIPGFTVHEAGADLEHRAAE